MKNRSPSALIWLAALLALASLSACRRAPRLPAPESAVVTVDGGLLHVEWSPVEGADCYYVYRAKESDSAFGYWGVTEATRLTDRTASASALYAYKIFAAVTDGSTYSRSDAYTVTQYACFLPAPEVTGVVLSEAGCTISWEPVELATGYEILRSASGNGDYLTIANTPRTLFLDTDAAQYPGCRYMVRALCEQEGMLSGSQPAETPPALGSPAEISVLRQDKHTALIYWDAVAGAESYMVYRADAPNGSYALVGESSLCLLRDTTVQTAMTTAYYKVQASSSEHNIANRGVLSPWGQMGERAASVAVPVLQYHDFVTPQEIEAGLPLDPNAIYASEFAADLLYLRAQGFNTIQLADLAAYLDGNAALPANPIIITIDDGSRGVYNHAYPLLRQYGMRAVLNVVGANIDAAETNDARLANGKPYCTWAELGEMARSGVIELQAHGYHLHSYLGAESSGFSRRPGETDAVYNKRLSADLLPLNAKIEQCSGSAPLAVAYPYNIRSTGTDAALTALGYRFLLAGDNVHSMQRNYFISGLEPALQDPLLRRIPRLSGTDLSVALPAAINLDER